jgi:membrane protein
MRVRTTLGRVYRLLESAGRSYAMDRVNRMAAAVAYRTIFALAPLLIVAVAIFGFAIGSSDEAVASLLSAIENIAGSQVADAVESLLTSAVASSDVTAIVGVVLFAWTASSLFIELQNNLNDIFRVPYERTAGLAGYLSKRGLSLIWATSLGLILTALWFLNAGWSWLESLFPAGLEGFHVVLGWGARIVSLALLPLIFALVFKTLTRAEVRWRAILVGSFFTAVMFMITAVGAGLYFAWDSATAASQIAGAFFVILLLAYVLSAVFLFGAQVTRVYNESLDSVPLSTMRQ